MKLLLAECRTTAQLIQDIQLYKASQNKRLIAMSSCEWHCCSQIFNTVHRNQEQKYAPISSPDLLAQRGHRGLALPFYALAEPN